jgi:hypothetical protein
MIKLTFIVIHFFISESMQKQLLSDFNVEKTQIKRKDTKLLQKKINPHNSFELSVYSK